MSFRRVPKAILPILLAVALGTSAEALGQLSCPQGYVPDVLDWNDPALGWQSAMNGGNGTRRLYSQQGVVVDVGISIGSGSGCWGSTYESGSPNIQNAQLFLNVDFPDEDCVLSFSLDFSSQGAAYDVRNLSFVVSDVDQGSWDDATIFSPAPSSIVLGRDVERIRSGGVTYGGYGDSGGCSYTDPDCWITGTWNGPISSVDMAYGNTNNASSNPAAQLIYISDLQFCTNPSTLPVTLSGLEAVVTGDGLDVSWSTASETNHLGFWLYGRQAGGEWERLHDDLIAGIDGDSLMPRQYREVFPGAGSIDEVLLEDVDIQGHVKRHGPFEVGERHGITAKANLIDWNKLSGASKPNGLLKAAINGQEAGADRALLTVTQSGIQRVSHADLVAAGVDLVGVDASRIAVMDGGSSITRYVGGGEVFGPGSWIEFVGDAGNETLYMEGNIYELRVANSSQPTPLKPTIPTLAVKGQVPYEHMVEHAPQRSYREASPIGDPWFDERILARGKPTEIIRTLDLSNIDRTGGRARLEVEYWGLTSWADGGDDHHVQILFNGRQVADQWFDGLVGGIAAVDVDMADLVNGSNEIIIRLPGDTGHAGEVVNLEGVKLWYPRQSSADGEGRWTASIAAPVAEPGRMLSRFTVAGFSGSQVVGWARRPNGREFRDVLPVSNGQVHVPGKVKESIDYWLVDRGSEYTPSITPGIPQPLRTAQGDYLIIAHPDLMGSEVAKIEALQNGRGLSTTTVTVDRIYAAYSDHAVDPESIRRFVGASKPRYLLLVGGDSYDYNNYLGLDSRSFVPTHYMSTSETVFYSPSDMRHGDVNADGIPDVAVGRLPARSREELAQMVSRMSGGAVAGREAIFVSGASENGAAYKSNSETFIKSYARPSEHIAVDDEGIGKSRSMLFDALSEGSELVSFHGHSSFGIWDFGGLFTDDDVSKLPSGSWSGLVTQWGCWNSYFVSPKYDTMAHAFLLTPDRGAAAVFGSATLTQTASHLALGSEFMERIGTNGNARIGDAILAAQRAVAKSNPQALDALLGMNLLGDPAMTLDISAQRRPQEEVEPDEPPVPAPGDDPESDQ